MSGCEVVPSLRSWQRVQLCRGRIHKRQLPRESLNPELCIYREQTVALLQRYFRYSLDVGRLPSLLGREFFRAHYNLRRSCTFEDAVIFVHDVERCLEKLDWFSQQVLVWVVLQGYSQEEASRVLHCARRTIARHLPPALDRLTEVFLEQGML